MSAADIAAAKVTTRLVAMKRNSEAKSMRRRKFTMAVFSNPDTAQPAAQTKGRERYEGFVEALGRRLARGQTLAQEISLDIDPAMASPTVPHE